MRCAREIWQAYVPQISSKVVKVRKKAGAPASEASAFDVIGEFQIYWTTLDLITRPIPVGENEMVISRHECWKHSGVRKYRPTAKPLG